MSQLRSAVKLTFALLAVWLGLVWAGLLPRPAFLPRELDIEPLTFLLGTIAALLFGFWKNPAPTTAENTSTPPDESLQAEIRNYLKSRYEHRIRQKLAGREPVNLRKIPSSTGTSDEGAQNFITLPAEKVPSGMAELFDEARGRLLVVGAPGAGKTTLLLQLALALLERPGKDLPVLLNLATWRSEFATFDDWLQRILPLELGASKALAEKIRRNTPLILLLDGLDEVPEDARASCLKAIGEYGAEAKHRFVISSRIAEYAATQDAPVYLEVEVQPLTPQQVIDNLTAYVYTQPEAKPLLNALQTDLLLREAVANPFYLNTAQLLFAAGRKYSDFGFTADDVTGRQRELVERFVEDALGRKVKRDYPKEKVRKWLGFLAGKMDKNNLMAFELNDVQPSWRIKNRWSNLLGWAGVLIFLICQITLIILILASHSINFGTVVELSISTILFFVIVISLSLFNATDESTILTSEKIRWSWKKFKKNSSKGLIRIGCLLLGSFIILFLFIILNLDIAAVVLIVFLFLFLIQEMIKNVILGGLITDNLLQIKHPYQRFLNSIQLFNFSLFRHLVLRLTLFFEDILPLRLVTFLNEISLRHLLEFDGDPETGKGGGAWRWRHRIIQEYFLESEKVRK